jgi:hypothetical protein
MTKRTFEIKTKIIYEDDYKTEAGYEVACNNVGDEWIFVCSDSGWNEHGGYSMWQKVEE